MGVVVIARYVPKQGMESVLRAAIGDHVPVLRAAGLATDRRPIVMRAADGSYLEVFEWVSADAIDEAHDHPDVQALWERFESSCEYAPLGDLDEVQDLFAGFEPVDL